MYAALPVLVFSPTFPLSFACLEVPHAPQEVTSGRRAVFGAWSAHKTGVVWYVEQKSFKKRPNIAISFWTFCLQVFFWDASSWNEALHDVVGFSVFPPPRPHGVVFSGTICFRPWISYLIWRGLTLKWHWLEFKGECKVDWKIDT